MTEMVDTKQLIAAIEEHPILWDRTSELYKCRNATANEWNDVCCDLNPDFMDMGPKERSLYVQMIMKKWKNTRDTWMKAVKKMTDETKSASYAKAGKTFLYHEEMRFLLKVANPRSTPDSSSCLDHDTEDPEMSSIPVYFSVGGTNSSDAKDKAPVIPKKKPKMDQIERKVVDTQEDDRHLSFFKGIIPSLNQLDEEQVLEFQAGVINLLQNVRKRKSTSLALAQFQMKKKHKKDLLY